jgi:hypothetical protein
MWVAYPLTNAYQPNFGYINRTLGTWLSGGNSEVRLLVVKTCVNVKAAPRQRIRPS